MKIIIPILVGASIGYLTNWLAIKMLFRPLREKKILGHRVPFTPGLIPKERERMAKSIGEAVGMHLLTPEKIAEVVSSEETKERLEGFIKLKMQDLKSSDMNLQDFLDSINYSLPLEKIEEKAYLVFSNKLMDEELNIKLRYFLKENIYPEYRDKLINKLSRDGKTFLEDVKTSESFKEIFIQDISRKLKETKNKNTILADVIDDDLISKLEKSVDENKKNIVDSLRRLFYKEDIQEALIGSIENLVEENISKMITMFIDSQTITDKIFTVIKKYIDSQQAEDAASFIIKDSIQNILNTRVSYIAEKSMDIIDGNDISRIYDSVIGQILNDENKDKALELIIKNIKSNEETIKGKIDYLLNRALNEIVVSKEFKDIFKDGIKKSIDDILNRPFKSLLRSLDESTLKKVFEFTNNIINTRFKEGLFNIINLFDISKVVEEEINSFEVEYTEKLILEIADRELKAITRLGALLGAIMGLLTPLLQML